MNNYADPLLYKHNDFLKSCIKLAKSIVIKHKTQADKINDYLANISAGLDISSNPQEWKYFKNINRIRYSHPSNVSISDPVITLTSIDNAETIELNPNTINLHPKTKKDLLEFDKTYEGLIAKYPFSDIYIKACILDKFTQYPIDVHLKDFTIVYYNKALVEPQEDNLMLELQDWIFNYKVTWFFEQYALTDSLFTTAQLAVFYQAILFKIIAIRLKNAKTIRAHSYHIYSYLSSNKYIDEEFASLNFKQKFFFYRNILYLNNHIGHNKTFDDLISILFDEAKMAVSAIDYKQKKALDENDYTDYEFIKRPLNKIVIDQDLLPYTLDRVISSEQTLAPSNPPYWQYVRENRDWAFKNVIRDVLYTKDLVSVFYNYTDNVEYPLFETIVNTWAYAIETNRSRFLVQVNNVINNTSTRMTSMDAFKLFVYAFYKYNGITLTQWPKFIISHVVTEPMPNVNDLLAYCYRLKNYYRGELEQIKAHFPSYSNFLSTESFYTYTFNIYLYNIVLWIYKSNLHDMDDNGQMSNMIDQFFKDQEFTFGSESISDFLSRVNFKNINSFTPSQLYNTFTKIIDSAFDNRYFDFLNYVNTQKAIISLFKKMTSYTIQITDNYVKSNPILTKMKANRYAVNNFNEKIKELVNIDNLNIEPIRVKDSFRYTYHYNFDFLSQYLRLREKFFIEFFFNLDVLKAQLKKNIVHVNIPLNIELGAMQWIGTAPTQDRAQFLSENPL